MTEISFLLVFLILFTFLVCLVLIKKNRLLIFSQSWIFFWLFIAILNLLGSKFVPVQSVLLYLFFLLTISIVSSYSNKNSLVDSGDFFQRDVFLLEKLTIYVAFLVFPVLIYFCFKSFILLQSTNIYNFRQILLSSDSGILPTGFLPIFNLFIGGGAKFIMLASTYIFCLNGKKHFLFISILISTLISFVTLGRFPLYELGILFMLNFYDRGNLKIKYLPYMIFALAILLWVSVYRSSGYYSIQDVIDKHVIGYHTFGFYLLETKIDSSSLLENSWAGLASLGSFGYFLTLPLTWITEFTTYMQSSFFLEQVDFEKVGVMSNGADISANAFYTILYEPYLDFGVLGVFLIGCAFGGIINVMSRFRGVNVYSELLLIYVNLILITGIMKSPLIRHDIILPILIFSALFLRSKHNAYHKK